MSVNSRLVTCLTKINIDNVLVYRYLFGQHESHIFSKLCRNSRGHGNASIPAGPGKPDRPGNPRLPTDPSSP